MTGVSREGLRRIVALGRNIAFGEVAQAALYLLLDTGAVVKMFDLQD